MSKRSRQLSGLWWLAAVLASGAAVVAGLGVLTLAVGGKDGTSTEIGKWLLSLSTALLVAGAISAFIRLVELARADREQWTHRLHLVIAARQTVRVSQMLLQAQLTAKTYTEQISELVQARAELRRLQAEPDIRADDELLRTVKSMRRYLDALGTEYGQHYLSVARQERLDEEWLKKRIKEAVVQGVTVASAELRQPLPAEDALQREPFVKLAAFRDPGAFKRGEFMLAYETAKRRLEALAGVRRKADLEDVSEVNETAEAE